MVIDLPGIELELVDINVAQHELTITRKIGDFEERNIASKYAPLVNHRNDRAKLYQTDKEVITLPCVVIPAKKQAFYYHGTVFMTIDKVTEAPALGGGLARSDFISNGNIF